MPHQCLKCGTLFAEGTTTILRGCPECRGTRFFFTQDPIPSTERERLLRQADRDLPALLQEILGDRPVQPAPPASPQPPQPAPPQNQAPRPEGVLLPGNRLLIKLPKQVRGRVKRALAQWDYEVAPPTQAEIPPAFRPELAPAPGPPARRIEIVHEAEPPPLTPTSESSKYPEGQRPETVRIDAPGQYEIDVKRLLESSPIVIQRDGTYLLHLPSIFEGRRGDPPVH